MPFKQTKIVCVYQKLDEIDENSRSFTIIPKIDFEPKECVVRQITYANSYVNTEIAPEYGNYTIWSSLNSQYIGSMSLKSQIIATGTTTINVGQPDEKEVPEYHYETTFSATPDTLITLQKKEIPQINFVIYSSPFKATKDIDLNGDICMILEFRE